MNQRLNVPFILAQVLVFTVPPEHLVENGGVYPSEVCIVFPAEGVSLLELMETIPVWAVNPRLIPESALPQRRVFRNGWTDRFDTDTVDVDLEKAKEIQKDRWREARAPKLEKLDKLFMRALEIGDGAAQAAIVLEKQALREITKLDLSTVTDADQLEAIWPNELLEEMNA